MWAASACRWPNIRSPPNRRLNSFLRCRIMKSASEAAIGLQGFSNMSALRPAWQRTSSLEFFAAPKHDSARFKRLFLEREFTRPEAQLLHARLSQYASRVGWTDEIRQADAPASGPCRGGCQNLFGSSNGHIQGCPLLARHHPGQGLSSLGVNFSPSAASVPGAPVRLPAGYNRLCRRSLWSARLWKSTSRTTAQKCSYGISATPLVNHCASTCSERAFTG